MSRQSRMSDFGELTELDRRILPAEPRLDHHLLDVMRPALDHRGRREQDRLAQRGGQPAQVLIMEEVAGKDLVDGDRPERAVAEVAQVLFLTIGRPRRIHVGDVVEGAERPASNGPGVHMLANVQR